MSVPITKPLGLFTQPNKYDAYPPGALSKALNVCLRDPGILSSLPDTQAFRANVMSSNYSIKTLYPMSTNILAFGTNGSAWQARWVTTGASTSITMPISVTLGFDTGIANISTTRSRIFVSTNEGPIVFDSEGDTTARVAGIPAPGGIYCDSATATSAQCMPTGKSARWRAIFVKKHSDGYETRGEVSYAAEVENAYAGTVDPTFRIYWQNDFRTLEAGDTVELYRTYFKDTGTDTGETYFLSKKYTLTSTDISNFYAQIRDTVTDDRLGSELYTNQGQEGLQNTNSPPPSADDIVQFKGYTLYLSRKLAPSITVRVNGPYGSLTTDAERTYGIGDRAVTGDTTNGSPTVTAISASDMLGIDVGQRVQHANFATGTTVASVGANQFTASANASATTVGALIHLEDVLELFAGGTHINTSLAYYLRNILSYSSSQASVAAKQQIDAGLAIEYMSTDAPTIVLRSAVPSFFEITARATNSSNYSPKLPTMSETALAADTDTRYNRWHFSKLQQPEAVPPLNYFFVGTGTVYRGIATRDCVWVFASDGLWRISGGGDSADDWRVDPVDPNLILASRNAVAVMEDIVYAYTNHGLVSIDSSGEKTDISRGVIGDPSTLPDAAYSDTWNTFIACDEDHHEVWLTLYDGASASTSYVYNVFTKAFTTVVQSNAYSAMGYSRALQSLVIGRVDTAPDVYYFQSDTSTTRMSGADVRFQPITGNGHHTLKEFTDVYYTFEGASTAMTLVPSFGGTNYTACTVPASSDESRVRVPVGRAAPAIAAKLTPGFTFSSGGTSNLWTLRGVSVRFDPIGEEVVR